MVNVFPSVFHIYCLAPVILDPNTMSPWVCLSDDLTYVRHTEVKITGS
uniref:SPRY-associated domain-containing protein n=1 Tax=Anguilla anguilla TaxID=7936 RepID=A0A0E9RP43_ANGAN